MSPTTADAAGPASSATDPVAPVQSVDRALAVLEILAARQPAGVTELAEELGVHKSTVSRLVAVLEHRGFVEQLSERGKYRLGFTLVRLAGATMARRDVAREGRRACEGLAEVLGETVNLAILDDGRAINILEASGPAGVALQTWVGQATPLHATSTGKSLLAGLDPAQVVAVTGEHLTAYTGRTVTDHAVLAARLAEVRAAGWSCAEEELEVGLNAVAAPVRDETGAVVAALSASGPAYRLGRDRFEVVAPHVVAAAAEVSRRLGHLPAP
ncbi:IclR family transcriptional regulator [Rhodococcus aerolatus]